MPLGRTVNIYKTGLILERSYHTMRIDNTSRCTYTLRAVGILIVALAVFGWGLHYKMSLYDSPSNHSTAVPHAKLLSQKERPAASAEARSIRLEFQRQPSSIFYPQVVLAAIVTRLPIAAPRWMRTWPTIRAARQQRIAATTFFSFRPPPGPNSSF
jgi:hypothetical protein